MLIDFHELLSVLYVSKNISKVVICFIYTVILYSGALTFPGAEKAWFHLTYIDEETPFCYNFPFFALALVLNWCGHQGEKWP